MRQFNLIGILFFSSLLMTAQELHLTVQPGQAAETQVTLSKADLQTHPVLWVQGHPRRMPVSVVGPNGVAYSGATTNPDAPGQTVPVIVYFADRESSIFEETVTAAETDGDATIVSWKENALPGVYTVTIKGDGLAAPVQLTLRRTTADRFHDEVEAKRKSEQKLILTSMFANPEQRSALDRQGKASVVFQEAWQEGDIVLISSTSKGQWTATARMPDGTVVSKESAAQLDCEWSSVNRRDDIYGVFPPEASSVDLMSCPGRMRNGSILIQLTGDPPAAPAELVAIVFRPSALLENIQKQIEDQRGPAGEGLQPPHRRE